MRTLCNKPFTIREYDHIACGEFVRGYRSLPPKTFNALEQFILSRNSGDATTATELLSLSIRRGVGKVIAARNYVGVIAMNDGTTIEILPKIADSYDDGTIRKTFLEMLKTLKNVAFKEFSVAKLKTDRLNLLDIFIKMFLDEVARLVRQGLKAAYNPIESNERFYKGKLVTSQHIKHNLVRKERVFVCYDDFNINRSENRLIKSTLAFVAKRACDERIRRSALRMLIHFDGVDYSTNYESDFSVCLADRGMSHYEKSLAWCRVFLRGNSFTAFSGTEIAFALLFPMERVFESFVATKIRKHLHPGWTISLQDNQHSLFNQPKPSFRLRPDIVLNNGRRTIVLDTKWKLLSNSKNISQSDMYQVYVYGKKYSANKVVLLYPHSALLNEINDKYVSSDNVTVKVAFFDLMDSDNSTNDLLENLCDAPNCASGPVTGTMA